jgi:large subunit ribosomal protein L30
MRPASRERSGTGMANQLKITWVRSAIRRPKNQKLTLGHLGLRRLNQTVVQPDNPAIRGMVNTVVHLVTCEEIKG